MQPQAIYLMDLEENSYGQLDLETEGKIIVELPARKIITLKIQ